MGAFDDLIPQSSGFDDLIPKPSGTRNAIAGSRAQGFAKGAKDILDGGAQLALHALPSRAIDSVNQGTQYLNDQPYIGPFMKALGMVPASAGGIDAEIARANKQYEADRIEKGRGGFDWARMGGNVAATLPMAAASIPASAAGRIGAGTIQGGLLGMLQPVTEETNDFASQKAKQTALGAAGGMAGGVVGEGLGRLIRPNASLNPDVKLLREAGVNMTPGQVLGGIPKSLEDKATSIPWIGDSILSARKSTMEDFNRAAYQKVADKVGQTIPRDASVGSEGMAALRTGIIDPAYETARRNVQFRPDAQFGSELNTITNMVSRLPDTHRRAFSATVDDELLGRLTGTGNGMMDGASFKAFESAMGREAKKMHSAPGFDQDLGAAYAEVLKSARSALERSNPAAAQHLQASNAAFSQYAPIRRAASSLGAEDSMFTPAQLMNALKASDQTAGKRAFTERTGDLLQLAAAGKSVLPSKIPDSGTAGRGMAAGGLAAMGAVSPWVPAAGAGLYGATSAAYSEPGRKLLMQLLASRGSGQTADKLAEAMRYGMPLLGVSSTNSIAQ